MKEQEKFNFEQALERLQMKVKNLESGNLSLEQSLKEFEEGIELSQKCQKFLSEAEQRVQVLTNSAPESNSV